MVRVTGYPLYAAYGAPGRIESTTPWGYPVSIANTYFTRCTIYVFMVKIVYDGTHPTSGVWQTCQIHLGS